MNLRAHDLRNTRFARLSTEELRCAFAATRSDVAMDLARYGVTLSPAAFAQHCAKRAAQDPGVKVYGFGLACLAAARDFAGDVHEEYAMALEYHDRDLEAADRALHDTYTAMVARLAA